jgi:hypothetical protein
MAGWWTIRPMAPGSSKASRSADAAVVESTHRPLGISALEEPYRHDAFTDHVADQVAHRPLLTRARLGELVRRDIGEPTLELRTSTMESCQFL